MTDPCRSRSALVYCSRAIALNNEGATSLASGDMALAIATFCQALHMSKSCLLVGRGDERMREEQEKDGDRYFHHRNYNLDESHEERSPPHSGSEQQDLRSLSSTLPHFDIGHLMEADCFDLNANEENNEQYPDIDSISNTIQKPFSISSAYSNIRRDKNEERSSDITNTNFIYRKPIRVPESYAYHAGLQRSEVILPSIVIFNLALAHHMWAMKKENELQQDVAAATESGHGQRSSSLLLKKSTRLYVLAIQLQEGQMVEEGPQSYSKLFFLSCINNLGNAHRLLGDVASSEKIYQQLLTMIMFFTYSEEQQGYELSTTNTISSVSNTSSSSTQSMSTSTFSAGRTYGSFLRNIFQGEMKSAPAA
jgi:hypothetical protein